MLLSFVDIFNNNALKEELFWHRERSKTKAIKKFLIQETQQHDSMKKNLHARFMQALLEIMQNRLSLSNIGINCVKRCVNKIQTMLNRKGEEEACSTNIEIRVCY